MDLRTRPRFEYLDNNDMPIASAHQGGDGAGVDRRNTMPAFEAAYDMGYRYFETDAIVSEDGYVLAFHGAGGRREAQRSGLPRREELQGMSYQDIRAKYSFGGEEIPLMEEVLTTWPDVRVNIDPKTNESVRPLARLIGRLGVTDRVCVTAFNYERTKGVAAELGGQDRLCTGLGPLGFVALKSHGLLVPGYLTDTRAACLQLPHQYVSRRMVDIAFHHGLEVIVWTPNEPDEIADALNKGVDGVMSDNVVDLKRVLVDRNEWAEVA